MIPNFFAASCQSNPLFTVIPTWYEFLPSNNVNGVCTPSLVNLADIWLILLAIIEILLRVAALLAVFFVIYGGVLYATSQGSPEQTGKAKSTLINALIGLALAITAGAIVAFIGEQF